MDRLASVYFGKEDDLHVRELRHELHKHAELEFDLPETKAIVEGELDRLKIPYTEKYAPCSVVAYLNYGADAEAAPPVNAAGHVFTLAFRADMDALPITEKSGVPFASVHEGIMHACGHDTHTAMLLGAAAALKKAELDGALGSLRIKLIFQPNEEGEETGSQVMIDNGVLEDTDIIFGQHIDMDTPTGTVLWIKGPAMAACHSYNITFLGKKSHATQPQEGHDAIAMALKACEDIYLMRARELSPFTPNIVSVGAIHGGTAHNIICDRVELKISTRFFHDEVAELLDSRIRQICEDAAAELSGTVRIEDAASTYAVTNDPAVTDLALAAARKITTEDKIREMHMRMGSEDFSCFQRVRPGAFFHLGGSCPEKGCVGAVHNETVVIDEDAFLTGSMLLVQLALDMAAQPENLDKSLENA